MTTPSPGKRRMDTDVLRLIQSRHKVRLLSGLNEFIVKFEGPPDTPYQGGLWNIRVELPERYPYKSPSIGFMNRIFHPNIDEPSGSVCLDVINQTWTPLYDLKNIFEQFLPQLLTYPNPSDPLNGEAATMYLHNKEQYIKKVKESVQKYATAAILAKQSNLLVESSSDEEDENDKEVARSSDASRKQTAKSSQSTEQSTNPPFRFLTPLAPQNNNTSNHNASSKNSQNGSNSNSSNSIPISSTTALRKSPEQNSNDSALPVNSFQSTSSQGHNNQRPGSGPMDQSMTSIMGEGGDEEDHDDDDLNDDFEDEDCSDMSENELEMDF